MNKVSFCIPLKNNLRYFTQCYTSIIKNADVPFEIIVYLDSDNDKTEEFLIANNIKYSKNLTSICKGISHGYNECVKLSTGNIILVFHADMILGPKALSTAINYLKERTIVSLTRIEPPLHPPGNEKIVMNFGLWPEKNIKDGFNEKEFEQFVLNRIDSTKTTNGIFAPWIIHKTDIERVGLHDELFHSYHEDSDIFNRFILHGYTLIQSWSSYVYHLTCRGGQFQDGLTITHDVSFHKMKANCARNYLRKWGNWIKNNEYSYPIIKNKYDIGFIVNNCNEYILSILEPWCATIYVDCNYTDYIKSEQPNTPFELSNRIASINSNKNNDILISINAKLLNADRVRFLTDQLSDVISDSGEMGEMEYDIFKININNINTRQKDLIL